MRVRITLTDEPMPDHPERLNVTMESDDPGGIDLDDPQTPAAQVAVAAMHFIVGNAEVESIRHDRAQQDPPVTEAGNDAVRRPPRTAER